MNRPILLLLAGATLGVVAAGAGLVGTSTSSPRLGGDAVARVNGTILRREDYDRMLGAAGQDRRSPLDAETRRHILDRMIDEELLVQRALELGLAASDRKVRADLTMSVISAITEDSTLAKPSDDELRRFYEENADFFSGPGRLRVAQVFVRVPSDEDEPPQARERATKAAERLRAGETLAAVRADLGDAEIAPLPDTLLPPAKLRDYIGPTALQAALGLDTGEVSDPVRSSSGYSVLVVAERKPDSAPDFAAIQPQVLAEFRRRAGDEALRRYVDGLRQRADVEIIETSENAP